MTLEIFSIGSSGSIPLPGRFLSSFALRKDGDILLFDCGEATQIAINKIGLKLKSIKTIFISHLHADHVSGLPGILMSMTNTDRQEPLYIIGPEPLKDYIDSHYRTLKMYKNYEIIVKEIDTEIYQDVFKFDNYKVRSFPLIHSKPCVGYSYIEDIRAGQFNPAVANDLGIPKAYWSKLQKFEDVEYEGKIFKSDMVLGKPRKGRKVSYITDTTIPCDKVFDEINNSDYLVCESTFKFKEEDQAIEKFHLSSKQAEFIAKSGKVKSLILTHFSPRYTNHEIKELIKEVDFPTVYCAHTGLQIPVEYED